MSLQCPAPTTRSTPHLVQRQVLLLSQDLVAQLQLQGLKGVLARCWGEGSLQAGKQLQQLVAAAAAAMPPSVPAAHPFNPGGSPCIDCSA